jgi:hypothetical protein
VKLSEAEKKKIRRLINIVKTRAKKGIMNRGMTMTSANLDINNSVKKASDNLMLPNETQRDDLSDDLDDFHVTLGGKRVSVVIDKNRSHEKKAKLKE